LSQSRKASQWIAATIFRVTSGSAKNARSSAAVSSPVLGPHHSQ
jgi:hypothetical protein